MTHAILATLRRLFTAARTRIAQRSPEPQAPTVPSAEQLQKESEASARLARDAKREGYRPRRGRFQVQGLDPQLYEQFTYRCLRDGDEAGVKFLLEVARSKQRRTT